MEKILKKSVCKKLYFDNIGPVTFQANLPVPTSLLKFVSTPNGMTFPLSPAKPDDTSKYPVGHHRKAGHMVRGQVCCIVGQLYCYCKHHFIVI